MDTIRSIQPLRLAQSRAAIASPSRKRRGRRGRSDMSKPYIFLANAKDDEPGKIEKWLVVLRDLFPEAAVFSAREDFMTNFSRCGGWREWCGSVVLRHDAFVVPERMFVGQATADIIQNALAHHKQVAVLSAGALIEIKRVEGGHGRWQQGGWKLCVTPEPADGARGSGRTPLEEARVDDGLSSSVSQVPKPRQEPPTISTEEANIWR